MNDIYCNQKAEQAVIGSMLIDDSCIPDVLKKARPEDFCLEVNREIFDTMRHMHFVKAPIDPLTVIDKLRAEGKCRESTERYLLELMQVTPTAANVMKYVEILNEETMRRRLSEIPELISEKLSGGMPPQDVCVYVQDKTAAIAESVSSGDLMTSLEACTSFYDYLEAVSCGEKPPFVPTGYGDLDRLLGGGLMREGLYILAGRPGTGKTTLALQIADKAAKAGIPTLFFSLEMSDKQIVAKRVAADSGLNYTKVITGKVDAEGYEKISDSCSKLSDRPLMINRRAGATVEDISFLAHQVKGLGLIVIDYLGLIKNPFGIKLYDRVTDTSNKLKELARSLGVPILCLAQLNREVENRASHRPRASDLRDSGAIEQDADGIILLHRDMEIELPDNAPADLGCIVGKNRHGGTGEINFKFYLPSGRIYAVREG